MTDPILIGKALGPVFLLPAMANRHGLVAGATGTGKTVTLQRLAESFSRIGVPVFMADVKGDLAGISQPGGGNTKVQERVKDLGLGAEDFSTAACPVTFWDILGEQGHPVRTTLSDMGPVLMARLLGLNETQEGVLTIVFRLADDNGWLLLDIKDLRTLLGYLADNPSEISGDYGHVSKASVGAIQRKLLTLDEQGAVQLFGEPALDIADLMQTDERGQGYINLLAADKLIHTPDLYSTFLLWLLAELFEKLPEVGDVDKPRLVFFFDEAHLLFDNAPKVLLDKIEQVVRLIRSKGVGIYFLTQSPADVPDDVLGQLGNRVQHALRAFTPRDQKAVRVAAQTFRANPAFDTETLITNLGVGEALVSTLDETGTPTIVERTKVAPPGSRIGPISPQERRALMEASLVKGIYEEAVDRESAYEILRSIHDSASADRVTPEPARRTSSSRPSPLEALATSTLRSFGSQLGRSLVRGLLGSLLGGRR